MSANTEMVGGYLLRVLRVGLMTMLILVRKSLTI